MSRPQEGAQHLGRRVSATDHALPESPPPHANQKANSLSQQPIAGSTTGAPSTSQTASPPLPHRIRRRNRMITSCLECRRRKLKCDKLHPCTNCARSVRDCIFVAPALDSTSQLKLTLIKEQMGVLERGLETEVAHAKKPERLKQSRGNRSGEAGTRLAPTDPIENGDPALSRELADQESEGGPVADAPEDENTLEPTPMAVVDAAYDNDGDDDDLLDLGVRIGKLR